MYPAAQALFARWAAPWERSRLIGISYAGAYRRLSQGEMWLVPGETCSVNLPVQVSGSSFDLRILAKCRLCCIVSQGNFL